jgi:transcriptional regulator with XRE-family HTH domain
MTPIATKGGAGELLRGWRNRRRLSQLDLALEANVSPRHLSFVETGRSQPSRELLLCLADHLEIPLREQNALLLTADYAPVFSETPLDTDEMRSVRHALKAILSGHEPYRARRPRGRGARGDRDGRAPVALTTGTPQPRHRRRVVGADR